MDLIKNASEHNSKSIFRKLYSSWKSLFAWWI